MVFRVPCGHWEHLLGQETARRLSNIPLIWIMKHAERHALRLPETWRECLHLNANAPSVGMSRWLGRLIWVWVKRQVKLSNFEWIHPLVLDGN